MRIDLRSGLSEAAAPGTSGGRRMGAPTINSQLSPPFFALLGPTAVGKSRFAVQLAQACNAEIIGADAFQVYAGLDLLTAKPEADLRATLPHHLIGEIPLTHPFDAGQYVEQARKRIAEVNARGKCALIVGGTGLYIRALTRGLAQLPPANPALRSQLEAAPLKELQQRLRELDPESAVRIDLKNPRRLVRALEVCLLTGRPFSSFRTEWAGPPDAQTKGVILMRDRDDLDARINQRTKEMFARGVVEEVRGAGEIGPTARQAIGLKQIHALLRSEITSEQCLSEIQLATRQYARRQLTWLRRETSFDVINLTTDPAPDRAIERCVAMARGR
jgi:tRNA dimethylallyltransferase